MKNKFKPKKITTYFYYSLWLIATVSGIIRWISAFTDIVVINAEINSHISNFSLSLLLCMGVGFTWLLQGVSFSRISILSFIIIIANIMCETVMGFMNTTDILDAVYGITGTAIGFCFLFIVNQNGIEINIDDDLLFYLRIKVK